MKEYGRRGLLLLCVVGVLFSTGKLVERKIHEFSYERENREFSRQISRGKSQEMEEENTEIPDKIRGVQKLKEKIPDLQGWIEVEETNVSFPIVQGKDNEYYLNHSATGEPHPFGAVFLDAENSVDFSDWNTVIYGHNIRTGGFFHELAQWVEQGEGLGKLIHITHGDTITDYRIVAVFSADPNDDYRSFEYTGEKWGAYEKLVASRSPRPVKLEKGKRRITLSTCGNPYRRFVLVGEEISQEE